MSTKMAYSPAPAPPTTIQTPRPTAAPRRVPVATSSSPSLRYGSSPLASTPPFLPFGSLAPTTTTPSSSSNASRRRFNLTMPPPPPPLTSTSLSSVAGPSSASRTSSSPRSFGPASDNRNELFRPARPSRLREDTSFASVRVQPPFPAADAMDAHSQSSKRIRLMDCPPPPPALRPISSASLTEASLPSPSKVNSGRKPSPAPQRSLSVLPQHMKRERETTPSSSSRRGSRASSLQPSASSLQLAPDLLQLLHPEIWKKQEQWEASPLPEKIPFLDFDFSTLTPGAKAKDEVNDYGSEQSGDVKERRSRSDSWSAPIKHRFSSTASSPFSRARTPSRNDASGSWVRTMSPMPSFSLSSTQQASKEGDAESRRILERERQASSLRMLSTWEKIAKKYGSINPDEDDEVDLMTGEVIKNRGVVEAWVPRDIGECGTSEDGEDEVNEVSGTESDEVVLVEPEDEDILGIWGEGSGMDVQLEHLPIEGTERLKAEQNAIKAEPSASVEQNELPSDSKAGKKRKRGIGRRFDDDDPDLQMFLRMEQQRREMYGEPDESSEDESATSSGNESEADSPSESEDLEPGEAKLSELKHAMLKQQVELDSIHPRFRRTMHAPVPFFAEAEDAAEDSSDGEIALQTPRRTRKNRRSSTQSSAPHSALTSSPWKSCVSDMLEEQEASDGLPSSPPMPAFERDLGVVLERGGVEFQRKRGRPRKHPLPDVEDEGPRSDRGQMQKGQDVVDHKGRRCLACFEAGLDSAWECPGRFRRHLCQQLDSDSSADEVEEVDEMHIGTPSDLLATPTGQVRKCLSCFEAGSANAWTCRGRWRPRFCERLEQQSEQLEVTLELARSPESDIKQRKCKACFAAGLDSAWTCRGRHRPHLCDQLQTTDDEQEETARLQTPAFAAQEEASNEMDVKQRRCRSCFEAGLDSAWSCRGRYRPHLCERLRELSPDAEEQESVATETTPDEFPAPVDVDVKQRKCRACFEAGLDSAWTCRGRWRPRLCERLPGNEVGEEPVDEGRPASPAPSETFSESSDVLYLGSRRADGSATEGFKLFDGNVGAVVAGERSDSPTKFATQILPTPIVGDASAAIDELDNW